MLQGFKLLKLNEEDVFTELTDNTLVLFNNSNLLYKFSVEFDKIIAEINHNKENEDVLWDIGDEKECYIKRILSYKATHIYDVNNGEQRIILSVEPTIILTMKDMYDLWFVDSNNENEISFWSLVEFKGYGGEHEMKKYSVIEIYKDVCGGRFGCYEGYFGK